MTAPVTGNRQLATGNCLQRRVGPFFVLVCLVMGAAHGAATSESIAPGAVAAIRQGRALYLECRPPKGVSWETFLRGYIADPKTAAKYQEVRSAAIPFNQLNSETQRAVLLAIFRNDVVDTKGWTHEVLFAGGEGQESLRALSEWITGQGANYRKVMNANRLKREELKVGQRILFPAELLPEAMKKPTPTRPTADMMDLEESGAELIHRSDSKGKYAEYRLKPGEALYTAAVIRFTDYRDHADILKACEEVRERSGITDVHAMATGQRIKIPLDMLAARFRPEGSRERRQYEEIVQEAKRLRGQVRTRDLDGVVVVIDPGHGGRDHGAKNPAHGLYEDELNYDIACRVKRILEGATRARVYLTLRDPKQGYNPTSATRFTHDIHEELLTTPPYKNTENEETDAKVSVNLRWYLANSIYRKELKRGTDKRKIVFTSFHCDALFNGKARGTMVYIPGAQHRGGKESHRGPTYDRYAEVREQRTVSKPAADCKRDEALSRNFAETLLEELGKKRIKRHQEGDPIRSQIRQRGGRVYVPGVLRNTLIPTKVLVEIANLTNDEDCTRIADPEWRERFAEAYVNALKVFFGS